MNETSERLAQYVRSGDFQAFADRLDAWSVGYNHELYQAIEPCLKQADDRWLHRLMTQPLTQTPIVLALIRQPDWARLERLAPRFCEADDDPNMAGSWAMVAARKVLGTGELPRLAAIFSEIYSPARWGMVLSTAAREGHAEDARWLCQRLMPHWSEPNHKPTLSSSWQEAVKGALQGGASSSEAPARGLESGSDLPAKPCDSAGVFEALWSCPVRATTTTVFHAARLDRQDVLDVLLQRSAPIQELLTHMLSRFRDTSGDRSRQEASQAMDALVKRLPWDGQVTWAQRCPEAVPQAVSRIRERALNEVSSRGSSSRPRS